MSILAGVDAFGGRSLVGTVVEDCGSIGAHDARLLAVRIMLDESDQSIAELPAEELHAA